MSDTIMVNIPGVGEVEMKADGDKIKALANQGAAIVNEDLKPTTWIGPGQIGTGNVAGGFVGSNVDWADKIPKISEEDIKATVEAAVAIEQGKQMTIEALGLLAQVALSKHFPSAPLTEAEG